MSGSEPQALTGQTADLAAPASAVRSAAFVPDGLAQLILAQKEAAEIVERMRETHTDAAGQAFLLQLDALIVRLGAKWEVKRDLVFEHLSTAFERAYPEPCWCVQVNEDAWLGLFPGYDPVRGARAMVDIWNELCGFFVGDMSDCDVPLSEVHVRDVDRLALKKVSFAPRANSRPVESAAGHSKAEGAPGGEAAAANCAAKSTSGEAGAPQRPIMVMASLNHAGRNLKIASAIEPLFEMRKMVTIGHRLEPTVMDGLDNGIIDRKNLGNLDWGLRELIDIVNIDQGLKLLRTRTPEQRKMMMVVPAAFSTFASARARQKITTDVSKAATEMGLKVLFEVRGLDGVPPHRVLEIVSLIKPFAMTVVGSVASDRRAIGGLAKCGLSGVCIEYDGGKRDEEALKDYLSGMASAAKAAAGACLVQGFDNYRQMAVARLAGVTHASLKTSAMFSPKAAPVASESDVLSEPPVAETDGAAEA